MQRCLISFQTFDLCIQMILRQLILIHPFYLCVQIYIVATHPVPPFLAVQVFRLCIENSIEEKVIEKAYKKLRLDALVIQQGRLSDNSQSKVCARVYVFVCLYVYMGGRARWGVRVCMQFVRYVNVRYVRAFLGASACMRVCM